MRMRMSFLRTLQQIHFHFRQPAVFSPLSSFTLTAAAPSSTAKPSVLPPLAASSAQPLA